MNQTEIRYALSVPGFRILASAAGINHMPCFAGSAGEEEASAEVYQTELFELVKRGLIEVREEQYHLNKTCSDMIRTIRDRKKTCLFQGDDIEQILYIADDKAVEATPGRKKDEYICLGYLDREELIEHIRNILPDNLFPEEMLSEKKDSDEIPETGEDVLKIEVFGATDKTESIYRIFINEDYLYYAKNDEVKLYLKEEFIGILTDGCGEAK